MITHTMDLDVVPDRVLRQLWLSEGDNDFSLVFNLFARTGTFTVESGTTIALNGTLADGTEVTKSATYSGTTVTVAGDSAITAVPGKAIFELTMTHSGKVLNTANFYINVEAAAKST